MPRSRPRVTAAIPAYNAERYLGQALQSVADQTFACSECLVIDDGSTDRTVEVAGSFPFVRCVSQPNGGDANARNRAIREAEGDFVAFLDSDDLWLPDKLEKQMLAFERRSDLAMVYTGVVVVDAELNPIQTLRPAPPAIALRNTLLLEKPYMTGVGSSGVVRTAVARSVLFDERLGASADWAFACHVALRHPVAPVEEALTLYRQHAGSQIHLNLRAVEADTKMTWREIFNDPALDRSIARYERRARANLHLSLAASHQKQGEIGHFLAHLGKATLTRPDRVVAAFWRRYMGPPP